MTHWNFLCETWCSWGVWLQGALPQPKSSLDYSQPASHVSLLFPFFYDLLCFDPGAPQLLWPFCTWTTHPSASKERPHSSTCQDLTSIPIAVLVTIQECLQEVGPNRAQPSLNHRYWQGAEGLVCQIPWHFAQSAVHFLLTLLVFLLLLCVLLGLLFYSPWWMLGFLGSSPHSHCVFALVIPSTLLTVVPTLSELCISVFRLDSSSNIRLMYPDTTWYFCSTFAFFSGCCAVCPACLIFNYFPTFCWWYDTIM